MSNEAQDLLKLLLNKDPTKRPSAAECLEHQWFKIVSFMGLIEEEFGSNISRKDSRLTVVTKSLLDRQS